MRKTLTCLASAPLVACTPPAPAAYDGFDGVSPKVITVIMGAPIVDKDWDGETGPVTWRRETLERYDTPRRLFRNGRWLFDGFTTHEFVLTCDLTATLESGRVVSATLTGAPRACESVRADAVRVAALVDILKDDANREAAE